MINIWTGLSGSGKTEQMFRDIDFYTADDPLGENIYILTPTQNTLQYENIITSNRRGDGRIGSMRTGVFSFQRFMWHIFNEIGQSDRETLSDSGHIMMLHKLMHELKDELKFYRDSSSYIKFSKKVLDMLKEFRAYQVTPEDIAQVEGTTARLSDKFHDLALIYGRWHDLLQQGNIEDLSLMDHFIDVLHATPHINTLDDAVIYVDGFHNFTESEFNLLVRLSERAASLTVLLTHKRENKQLFRKTDAVIERFQNLAGESEVEIHQFEDAFRRSSKTGLVQLEEYFTSHKPIRRYDGVNITEAPNALEEVTETAREIERLCADGARLDDIGILYRDPGYRTQLDAVFRRFDIAYHIDQKVAMYTHPFIQFIIAVLDCYTSRFDFNHFMNVLKTGYLTADDERHFIARFENFALRRGLSGAALFDDDNFKKMLVKNDNGDIEVRDISDEIGPLIAFKDKVLTILESMFSQLDEAVTVKEYITIIYQFITDNGIDAKIEREIESLEARHDVTKRDETEQAYNLFIRLLDDAYLVFKDEAVPFGLFYETFSDGLKSAEFNLLPSTIDQVIIGSLDLAKLENKKYIFLLGMNHQVMPREARSNALLDDAEKSLLEAHDVILSPSAKVLAQDERFVFYLGMTRATDGLYISYAATSAAGESVKMSPYVAELLPDPAHPEYHSVFNKTVHFERFDPLRLVSSARSMEHLIHLKTRELMNTAESDLETLKEYPEFGVWMHIYQILNRSQHLGLVHRLKRNLTYDNRAEAISSETATRLYGRPIHASVSRFESFYTCHFQHFANYGLKLNIRETYEVAPLELGNLYHHVLEDVVLKLGKTLLHEEAVIKEAVSDSVDTEARLIQHGIFEHTGYYQALKARAKDAVARLLLFMKDIEKNGDYNIGHVELTFGSRRDDLGEVKLTSDEGHEIMLRGKIDRIDVFASGGTSYLNLIDYKSSARRLSKKGVLNGLELQMITYMYVLMDKGADLFSGEVKPNSMLFFPVKDPVISMSDESGLDNIEKERLKQLRPDGAFINEHPEYDRMIDEASVGLKGLLSDFDDVGAYSTYFPITVSKHGKINARTKGRYFSPALFTKYQQYVLQKYREAADDIYKGANIANPIAAEDGTMPCAYCDFKAACHIDYMINSGDIRENEITAEDIAHFESGVETDGQVDS